MACGSLIGCFYISRMGPEQFLGEQNQESDSCCEITLCSYYCELKMTITSSITMSWNCWLSVGLLTQQVALLWKAFLPWWKTQGSDRTLFICVLPIISSLPFPSIFHLIKTNMKQKRMRRVGSQWLLFECAAGLFWWHCLLMQFSNV